MKYKVRLRIQGKSPICRIGHTEIEEGNSVEDVKEKVTKRIMAQFPGTGRVVIQRVEPLDPRGK